MELSLLWNPLRRKSNKNRIMDLLFEMGMKGFSLPLPESFLKEEEKDKKRRCCYEHLIAAATLTASTWEQLTLREDKRCEIHTLLYILP